VPSKKVVFGPKRPKALRFPKHNKAGNDRPSPFEAEHKGFIKIGLTISVPEMKYLDTVISTGMGTAAVIQALLLLAQGLNVSQRLGGQVRVRRIVVRLNLVAGDAYNYTRVTLLVDKQVNKAIFVDTDLYLATASVMSPLQDDYSDRFFIIRDFTRTVTGAKPFDIRLDIPCDIEVYYSATGGTIANVASNMPYIVYYADSGAVPNPNITGYVRVFYEDF